MRVVHFPAMRIEDIGQEFFFKALYRIPTIGPGWELTAQFFKNRDDAERYFVGMQNRLSLAYEWGWPAEVYADGYCIVPDSDELK